MRRSLLGPLFVLPGVAIIFMFLVFPVFYGFYLSLFHLRFLQIRAFSGLANFVQVLGSAQTIAAIVRSLLLSVVAGMLTVFIGFWIAYWAHRRTGTYAYLIQITGLVPWVVSMVVGALLWKWILSGNLGLYNYLRSLIGLKPAATLVNSASAMGSLVFVVSWRTVGYAMVMILAGLKTVPGQLIEASRVDGCNLPQQLIYVVLPSIRTPLLVATIVVALSNLNNATIPLTLTGGGPANATNVVALELYRMAFVYNNYGPASALAVIVFVVNVILVLLYMRMVKWSI